MSTPPNGNSPRRRWWRWFAAAVVGVVLLIGGGLLLDRYLAQKGWSEACAEADRLDPGWRWDDLMAARPIPPDERNVSVRVQAIRAAMPQTWPDWVAAVRLEDVPPAPPPPPDDAAPLRPGDDVIAGPTSPEERRATIARSIGDAIDKVPSEQELRSDQVAPLRAVVASAASALPLTVGLEDLQGGRLRRERVRPLLNDLFPAHIRETRTVAQLLRWHATLLTHDGQPDAALADCRRMLGPARAAAAEPMLINALVAMAIRAMTVGGIERVLAQGEPGLAALDRTRRTLEAALAQPLILDGLRGDRAFFEDQVRSVDEGHLTSDNVFGDPVLRSVTGIARIDNWLRRFRGGAWSKRDAAAVLRFQTLLVEIAKESPEAPRTRSAEAAAFRTGYTQWLQNEMTHDKYFDADRRGQALVTSAAAALAAEHFRRDHGRWPASLGELVIAKLLTAVPVDPFDGQPLRLRRLPDGFVIYSVGQDLIDDGGDVRDDPATDSQRKDVGIRLWDPDRRRRPSP